jgi:hypothetical protein
MLSKLKENLTQAQQRTKKYADKNRSDRVFNVGEMVYLMLQPYIHNAFGLHQNLKLTTKFYGPFKIMEKIGNAAFKLLIFTQSFMSVNLNNTLVLRLCHNQTFPW